MASDEARWLSLERRAGETLRSALERTLREAIVGRALRAGVRLPASRALAQHLGVSRRVVSDAYGQLQAQGFLLTREREAPVVAAVQGRDLVRPEPSPQVPPPRYNLSPTRPEISLFPLKRWIAAAQHVTRRDGWATLDYREARGERVLREVLADHLGRTRGVIADPADIVIVQGTAQGVDLLMRVLRRRGASRVAVEDPSQTTARERIQANSLAVIPQPVDDEGMVVDGLDADAVLVTPAHQFPTGYVLSGERRRRLVAWACANHCLIIEDDYDAEFRYDREPVRALQGVAPEHVVQIGTVSKTLAPALRLGWLVVPAHLVDEVEGTKRLLDHFSPTLDQLTLAEFLSRGDYDRHVRRARSVYRGRRDRLIAALSRHLPELKVEGVAAGLHLVVRMPAGVDDSAIARDAKSAGINVAALTAFRIKPAAGGGLVIGYGRVQELAIEPAIRELAGVTRPHLRPRRSASIPMPMPSLAATSVSHRT
ncbi:MAG TPA: PLP-dependent aminotransferase family protein [Candidatus Dormibacteraeota bacterium]|nr:PLP-dependent aminotransferase family protein [Candidatus Dormibacteraeota bacterium]